MYKNGIKLLAIGNSFSQDAMYYLFDMLCQLGVNENGIVLVNACIGGCDLFAHMQNAKNDTAAYIRQTFHRGGRIGLSDSFWTLKDIIKSQSWDVITLQQASHSSGRAETYNDDLDYLINYVKAQAINPTFRLGWHMTWAYRENPRSIHPAFADYNFSQRQMYDKIGNAVKSKIVPNKAFDFIIPSGIAIQNARQHFGDVLNNAEDGFHLNNLGRYIAAVIWVKAITGLNIADLMASYNAFADGPGVVINENMLSKIIQSVNAATILPFA